jgi:hypothetical protein
MSFSCQTYVRSSQDFAPDIRIAKSKSNINQNISVTSSFPVNGFSYGSGLNLDLKTGNSPYAPNLPTNLYSRECVKLLKVRSTSYKNDGSGETMRIYNYQNGLLVSSYYSASDVDPNETYKYDILGRCIKEGKEFVFIYPGDQTADVMERQVYYKGNYHSTERISVFVDGYEINIKQANGQESSHRFIYENSLLSQVTQINITEGREWDWFYFKYENGLITEIINATAKKDDIRSITKIISYAGSHILIMEIQNFRQGHVELTEIWKFANYDEYGNWQDAACYSEGILKKKHHRDIEYN